MTPETLLNCLDPVQDRNCSNFTESLKLAVKSVVVEKFVEGEERPCDDNDFSEFKKYNEKQISFLKLSLEHIVSSNSTNETCVKEHLNYINTIDDDLLALLLVVCGENVSLKPWNTETTVKNCGEMLLIILKYYNCSSVPELVSKHNKKNLIKNMLHILQPNLLKTTWKLFPASILCYKWVLETIKQPQLGSFMSLILPTALLLVDDFVNENRITGVQCLHYIIENVTTAELQFHGHGDVVFNALIPLLRIKEASVIYVLMPCLISLAKKLETNFGEKIVSKWSKFDDILEIYLENMELENTTELRNCYMENMELVIFVSDVVIIRWSKRLLRIFKEYLQLPENCFEEKMTYWCLKALDKYIQIIKSSKLNLATRNLLYLLLRAFLNIEASSECDIQKESQTIHLKLLKIIKDSLPESYIKDTWQKLNDNFQNNLLLKKFYDVICSI